MSDLRNYKRWDECYDSTDAERTVVVNNGIVGQDDGYYMTIRQMTRDDMQGIVACLLTGQGEGCRSVDPLINSITKALNVAIDWEEE